MEFKEFKAIGMSHESASKSVSQEQLSVQRTVLVKRSAFGVPGSGIWDRKFVKRGRIRSSANQESIVFCSTMYLTVHGLCLISRCRQITTVD